MDQFNIRHKETQTAQAQGSIDSTVTCLYKKKQNKKSEVESPICPIWISDPWIQTA